MILAQTRFPLRARARDDQGADPRSWFKVNAAGDQAEVLIYDEIGMWGITAKDFAGALQKITAPNILVRLNSPGGDVFDGLAIYNALRAHPAKVTAQIDALAASIASIIALAGDQVVMAANAFMMVHNPWSMAMGDAAELRTVADTLEKVGKSLEGIYVEATGASPDQVKAWMDAETWFGAAEAIEAGLVDDLVGDAPAENLAAARAFNLDNYRNPPRSLLERPIARMAEEWKVGAAEDLPIDTADAWDGGAATDRILEAAGFNGDTPDSARARRGFLAYDAGNPHLRTSYKLPFADFTGGELKAVAGGIRAAASRLPDTGIPADVKAAARKVLDGYEAKLHGTTGNRAQFDNRLRRRLVDHRREETGAA